MKKHIKKQLLLYFPILFPNKKNPLTKKTKFLVCPSRSYNHKLQVSYLNYLRKKKIKNKM